MIYIKLKSIMWSAHIPSTQILFQVVRLNMLVKGGFAERFSRISYLLVGVADKDTSSTPISTICFPF
jgi:hypothetical protein